MLHSPSLGPQGLYVQPSKSQEGGGQPKPCSLVMCFTFPILRRKATTGSYFNKRKTSSCGSQQGRHQAYRQNKNNRASPRCVQTTAPHEKDDSDLSVAGFMRPLPQGIDMKQGLFMDNVHAWIR